MIPCIAEEVTRVSELYALLLAEAATGDRTKLKELTLLQASIRGRIQEFEEFYDQHATDPNIGFFEKQRLRLRKLLMMEFEKPEPAVKPKPKPKAAEAPKQKQSITTDSLVKDLMQRPNKTPTKERPLPAKPVGDWTEMVFRIKLTREEYNRLMTLKARKMKS
jgi:hypothetical protein